MRRRSWLTCAHLRRMPAIEIQASYELSIIPPSRLGMAMKFVSAIALFFVLMGLSTASFAKTKVELKDGEGKDVGTVVI